MYFNKKNIKTIIFFSLFLSGFSLLNAQADKVNLDSLYNFFVSTRLESKSDFNSLSSEVTEVVKCGLPLMSEINNNFQNFTPSQQSIIKSLMQWPKTDTSIISPSGLFRIHYDTTGNNTPNYDNELSIEENVHQIALAIDSTYNFEINFLGFEGPPPDSNEGGDNLYDIFIFNLGALYGQTFFSGSDLEKTPSYIEIDNDFPRPPFFTSGFDAARATLAHEFHHAIQIGSYKLPVDDDIFFYELTSTSMEEFVFDDVNDYYGYTPSYFNNTSKAFSSFGGNSGYDLCIWNIFLKEKFGFNIILDQWNEFRVKRAISAINISINNTGKNIGEVFNEFGIWVYFTDFRTKQGEYFEEAEFYPLVRSIFNINFNSPETNFILNAKPLTNNFVSIIDSSDSNIDTVDILISNWDYQKAINPDNETFSIEYFLFDYNAEGSHRLNDSLKYYSKFNSFENNFWLTSEFVNDTVEIVPQDLADIKFPFPTPFNYEKHNDAGIFIPLNIEEPRYYDFNVYTISMDLVFSRNIQSIENPYVNGFGIKWNPITNDGEKLASGVYIYAIKSGDEVTLGKLVIFNE